MPLSVARADEAQTISVETSVAGTPSSVTVRVWVASSIEQVAGVAARAIPPWSPSQPATITQAKKIRMRGYA